MKPFVIWLTGLPGSGKTTIAARLVDVLKDRGITAHHLDGDEVRRSLHRDLGFSKADRDANIAAAIELARLYQQRGIPVIASFISPYQAQRQTARDALKNFIEVFVDAPLAVCQARDPKGMYAKAAAGQIENFTGVSDPYEPPTAPELRLQTNQRDVESCVRDIVDFLKSNSYI